MTSAERFGGPRGIRYGLLAFAGGLTATFSALAVWRDHLARYRAAV